MKPKVAFFDFASCEGCQLQIANLEETVLDVANLVDIVSFREVMKEHSNDYDIAIIEGSIMRPMDEERLKSIRERAKVLIAFGACACLGGVQRLGNNWSSGENLAEVFPTSKEIIANNPYFDNPHSRALDEIVKVDYYLPGCPIDKNEFVRVLVALLQGRKPPIPDYPVCVECKKKENICLFTIGKHCMGPVARAGCGAICPTNGGECEACRGFVSYPFDKAHTEVLQKYGLSPEQIMNRKTMFNNRHIHSASGGNPK